MNISLDTVKEHPLVKALITASDEYLNALGYTEHSFRHAGLVAKITKDILLQLNYAPPLPELGSIAGYLHDMGNVINRQGHAQSAALMAMYILKEVGMLGEHIGLVVSAIGNHEEDIGDPVNPVAAALVLADKADVHKSRVRTPERITVDIHDRVNYAVESSFLHIKPQERSIVLELTINTEISQVMEYFEIFLSRMVICRRAAQYLNCAFGLVINNRKFL